MKKGVFAIVIPVCVGGIGAFISLLSLKDGIYLLRLEFVLTAIITCAVTFSGLILTSVSILIGLSSSPLMRHICETGGLRELRMRYTGSLILSLLLITFCIIVGADVGPTNYICPRVLAVGIGLLSSYIVSMLTTGYYLLGVIGLLPIEGQINTANTPTTPSGSYRTSSRQD